MRRVARPPVCYRHVSSLCGHWGANPGLCQAPPDLPGLVPSSPGHPGSEVSRPQAARSPFSALPGQWTGRVTTCWPRGCRGRRARGEPRRARPARVSCVQHLSAVSSALAPQGDGGLRPAQLLFGSPLRTQTLRKEPFSSELCARPRGQDGGPGGQAGLGLRVAGGAEGGRQGRASSTAFVLSMGLTDIPTHTCPFSLNDPGKNCFPRNKGTRHPPSRPGRL